MSQKPEPEPTWSLFIHIVNVCGLAIILSAFATGGSFRILLVGLILMSFGAAYSCFVLYTGLQRYLARKR